MGNERFGVGSCLHINGAWVDRLGIEIIISCVCLLIIMMVLVTCMHIFDMNFECGLETPKFHKIFILYNIMFKVPHALGIY
jgi:hypothetical protein